ncbi:hypothetical protein ACFWH2_17395, partial [Streptomyces sp. NPDC127033]
MTHEVKDVARSGGSPAAEGHASGMSRRSVLAGAVIGVAAAAGASTAVGTSAAEAAAPSAATSSGLVRAKLPKAVAEVVDAWAQAPSSHPVIGDWRRVGYRRGSRRPRATGTLTVAATDFGIRPNQPQDVSRQLQSALDDLGLRGGGVLKLAKGRYVLDNPLFIHDSHTV